jgi:hypothetical protein
VEQVQVGEIWQVDRYVAAVGHQEDPAAWQRTASECMPAVPENAKVSGCGLLKAHHSLNTALVGDP